MGRGCVFVARGMGVSVGRGTGVFVGRGTGVSVGRGTGVFVTLTREVLSGSGVASGPGVDVGVAVVPGLPRRVLMVSVAFLAAS